jgi:hypothetical protein
MGVCFKRGHLFTNEEKIDLVQSFSYNWLTRVIFKRPGTRFFIFCIVSLILSFETINKHKLFFEFGIPRPQDVGHLRF